MKGRYIITAAFALMLTSCHVPARYAMRGAGGRTSYNKTIQKTNNEQMLLNLVRLRYCDTPYFLDVGAVTAQFSQKGKLQPSFTIPGFDKDSPFKFGAEYEWQNNPTISYSPLEGSSFAKQLLQPIDLRTLQKIIYSGWNIDRVFRIAVQNIDNLPNARGSSGPAPEIAPEYKGFQEVAALLGDFQRKGQLLMGVRQLDQGQKDKPLCCQAVQLTFPTGTEEADRLAHLLEGVTTSKDNYYINLRVGFTKELQIGILPRSVLGAMYHLSLAVEVPCEHLNCGAVVVTKNTDGSLFDWRSVVGSMLRIHSSKNYPSNAFMDER